MRRARVSQWHATGASCGVMCSFSALRAEQSTGGSGLWIVGLWDCEIVGLCLCLCLGRLPASSSTSQGSCFGDVQSGVLGQRGGLILNESVNEMLNYLCMQSRAVFLER